MAKNLNPIQKRNRINRGLYIVLAVLIVTTMIITVIAFSAAKRSSGKTPPADSSSVSESRATDKPETKATEPRATERVIPNDTEAVVKPPVDTGSIPPVDTSTEPVNSGGEPSSADITFIMPAAGVVSKEFSGDAPVFSATMNDYRLHTGIDVTAETGSAVVCAADGTVANVYSDPLRGVTVFVEHGGGFSSLYQGLAAELAEGIEVGKKLSAGDVIGAVGSTDLLEISEEPHVHFELYRDGATVDPLLYLAAEEAFAYED